MDRPELVRAEFSFESEEDFEAAKVALRTASEEGKIVRAFGITTTTKVTCVVDEPDHTAYEMEFTDERP